MTLEEEIKQERFYSDFNKVIVNVLYTSSWLSQQHQSLFKDFGISGPQFNILRILRGQYPEASTVNLLIDRMLDKSSNASRIVDRLESKGLVIRKQCPSDRRAVDVFISQEGLDLLEKLGDKMLSWEQSTQNLTNSECEELSKLLDKMRGTTT